MYATPQALGRNWSTADTAKLFTFADCFRVHLYWSDGAEAYKIYEADEKALALADLASWGF